MSTDIKLAKAQISGGFLGSLLSKITGPLMKVAVPLAKHILGTYCRKSKKYMALEQQR